jgi:hypothetical protein
VAGLIPHFRFAGYYNKAAMILFTVDGLHNCVSCTWHLKYILFTPNLILFCGKTTCNMEASRPPLRPIRRLLIANRQVNVVSIINLCN